MAKIVSIPKIASEGKAKEYKFKLVGEGPELLGLYIEAYKEQYGETIAVPDMLNHIVMNQLTKDRGFRKYVKTKRITPKARGGS